MNLQNTAPAAFTIAKTVPDQMLVFGWGNVAADAGGAQIEDLQGDIIPTEELEKAAYDHVLRFRSTGEKHDPALRHKGRLVESCVFTREKQAAMGIPPGILPEGWWVGYKIDDPAAWAKIKSGEYQSFSVGGKGVRTPVEKARHPAKRYAELRKAAAEKRPVPLTAKQPRRYNGTVAKTYAQMRKFNPYHDEKGRFSSANGAGLFQESFGGLPKIGYQNEEEADRRLLKDREQWEKNLSYFEKESINNYTERSVSINDALRGKGPASPNTKSDIDNLDRILANYELKEDISTIRGTSLEALREMGADPNHLEGSVLSEKAYTSTSLAEGVAAEFTTYSGGTPVLVQIDVPAGRGRGAYLEYLSDNPGEREFLIKRDSSFQIYKVDRSGSIPKVKARMIV